MSSQKMNLLVERHCTTIKQMLAEFLSHYGNRTVGTCPNEEAMAVLHKLKGSSGSIGFSEINQLASEFEAGLKNWPLGENKGYEKMQLDLLGQLAASINNVKPSHSKLYAE